MRKFTWIILGIIALIWIAIAIYWTGTGKSTIKPTHNSKPISIPIESPTQSPELQLIPESSPSATPTPSIKLVVPTVNIGLKY